MSETIAIPARFNGPLESGNGGYSAGALAAFLEGAVEVSLRRPVPLDTVLRVSREDDGKILAIDGEDLAAEASPAPEFELDLPEPVGAEEARAASAGYRGKTDGPFSDCFVCSRTREDTLGVHAGPVEGRMLVATPWTPPQWADDGSGAVRGEIVWAVLDCPTYFAAYMDHPEPMPPGVLARFTGRLDAPVPVGEEHVVISWPIAADGRKHHAGVAIVSAAGEVLARAQALLIEPRQN
ncbi:MAG: hypothetical protein ABW196_02180 [Solirubrobacterales bacterium]